MNPLSKRIACSFGVVSIIFLIATFVIFIQVNKVAETSQRIQHILEPSVQTNLIMTNALNMSLDSLQSWILFRDDTFSRKRQAAWSIIDKTYKSLLNYSRLWNDPQQVEAVKGINKKLSLLRKHQKIIQEASSKENHTFNLNVFRENVSPLAVEIISDLRTVLDPQKWEMERLFLYEERQENFLKNIAFLFLFIGLTMSLALGIILTRTLKENEEELKQINEDLQLIFDNVPVRIWYKDDENKILRLNKTAADSMNMSVEKAEGANTYDLYPEQAKKYHDDDLEVINSGNPKLGIVEKYTPLDAPHGWVQTDKVPYVNKKTGKRAVFVVSQDITAQKEAAYKLELLSERQNLALEASQVGIWDWDVVNNILVWDEQMYRLYGITEETFSGAYEAWQKGVHPDDLAKGDAEIQLALKNEKKFDTEFRVLWPNGTVRNIRALATVIRDSNEQPLRMLGVNWDITNLKETEEELRRINQELEKFAYISSHDLKSPLRAIDNLSKWIEQDSQDALSEDSKKDMATLRSRVKRMNTLVDDLLQYSRIGHKKYDLEEVDVKQLVEEIGEFIDIPQGFEIEVEGDMPTFSTALPPLKQIFMNLIGNAIKHHNQPAQGKVTISSQDLGKFYEFAVSDNGPGIPKKFHREAFYMFKTLQSRDEIEGSGMGLAYIDKIVRIHGGTISLESEEDQGATFRFHWPKNIEREEGI